ncbi:O-antigen ligase family protein [Vibrio chagasii]|uniref:O-antigen ligase family protein n=1 Tax=Vibrio chagasii TaxID=170679 RepID=UPI003DA13AD6
MMIKKNHVYTLFLLLPYFFAVTGMMIIDDGDKKIIPFLLASIIASIISSKENTVLKNLRNPLIWLLCTLCLYSTFSYYYHGTSSREIRSLIGITLFLLYFPNFLLQKRIIRLMLLTGGFFICINSLYFNVYIGIERDAGYINPIPYATASALLFICAFSLLMDRSSFKNKLIDSSIALLYLPPIILSEARGVWLALSLSIFLIILARCSTNKPSKHQVLFFVTMSTILLSVSLFIFKDKISHRYNHTVYEFNNLKSGNYDTSIGWRIQLWKLAPEFYLQSPIIGLGHGEKYEKILKEKLDNNNISHFIYYYASSHYHNQFIDKLVKSGIVGVLLLVGLLVLPLLLLKNLEGYEKLIVIGATSLFFFAGLTDVPFNHPQPLMLYLLLLVPICSRFKRSSND